jgi:hypothetical protein
MLKQNTKEDSFHTTSSSRMMLAMNAIDTSRLLRGNNGGGVHFGGSISSCANMMNDPILTSVYPTTAYFPHLHHGIASALINRDLIAPTTHQAAVPAPAAVAVAV